MQFQAIDTVESISKEDFIKNYLKKRKPLLLKGYAKNWTNFDKWNLDYISDVAGDQTVPLYDSKPADANKSSDTPATHMKFNEYVDLIKKEPSDLRIFFFIIKDKIPELLKNFTFPDLGLKYFERLPTLFFGGSEAKVLMHYDVDMTDFIHFQF
ncbi:MAG: cupin-like domain-containing protein, partial [Algoriella sp.]